MSPNLPTPNFNDLLFQVAEKTFGELAFLLVEPDEIAQSKRPADPRWGYATRVEFTGPFNGEMHIKITEEMLLPLATNMLGIDEYEELPEGVKLEDALKELVNVTCGNLLPVLGGDQAVFHIDAPILSADATLPLPESLALTGQTLLHLDVGSAHISLFLDPQVDLSAATRQPETETEARS
ncbi:MAG: chemotaxis protein CheX [Phycisphaerae bacterium]|nr:chemotaxis protein CheX [Phycisphaerae bacterium]